MKSKVMSELIVREATGKDAGELTDLLRLLTDDSKVAVVPERLEDVRNRSDSFVFLAESSEGLVGTVQVTLCPDVMYRFQPYAVLENVFVREEKRGLGIGRAMITEVEKLCLANDCSKIMFLSSINRESAHRFFQSLGYDGDSKRGFIKYRKALRFYDKFQ
jgi:GNAT superfamily N-acetyltransferase